MVPYSLLPSWKACQRSINLKYKDWDFDSWAETYDKSVQENDWIHENYLKNLNLLVQEINHIATYRRISLLDVGAGTGNLIRLLMANPNIEFLAIEPSKEMRAKFQMKCPNVEIINGCLPDLPVLDIKFDVIVSSYVIHHVEHEKSLTMIKNFKRLLNPNGMILIIDIMFESKTSFDLEINRLKQQGLEDRVEEMLDEYFYFVDEFTRDLNSGGFTSIVKKLSQYVWFVKGKLDDVE